MANTSVQLYERHRISPYFGESAGALEAGLSFEHFDHVFMRVPDISTMPRDDSERPAKMETLKTAIVRPDDFFGEIEIVDEMYHVPIVGSVVEEAFDGLVEVVYTGCYNGNQLNYLFTRPDCHGRYFLGDSNRGAYGKVGMPEGDEDLQKILGTEFNLLDKEARIRSIEPDFEPGGPDRYMLSRGKQVDGSITLDPGQTLVMLGSYQHLTRVKLGRGLSDPNQEVVYRFFSE